MYSYINTCCHTHTHICIHMFVNLEMYTYLFKYEYTYVCVNVKYAHTHIYVCVCLDMGVRQQPGVCPLLGGHDSARVMAKDTNANTQSADCPCLTSDLLFACKMSCKHQHQHQWSSGRKHRCHRCDPGSTPG